MPRCIPTGKPASPILHPFAQMPALLAVATVQEIIEAGATCGRCITSQGAFLLPDTPRPKGDFALPWNPSTNPMRIGWHHRSRPMDHEQGRACPLQPSLRALHFRLNRRHSIAGEKFRKLWGHGIANHARNRIDPL